LKINLLGFYDGGRKQAYIKNSNIQNKKRGGTDMKKTWIVLLMIVMVLASATAFAGEVREVTVKGDAVRGPLVTGFVSNYFPDTKGNSVEDKSLGEYVIVIGPGGEEKIHFSPKLVAKLQKLAANPRAGEGLMDICPLQAGQLVRAVGPMKVAMDPLIVTEKISVCDKKGGCYGKILTGDYQTLRPHERVRLVSNTSNPKYPDNLISFKIEYHRAGLTGWPYGTGWGPTIVLRNITMENPLRLVEYNAGLILPYLESITALKKGQPGSEGDSCWEVVILRDGTLYKDESPAEAPFCRK